MIWKTILIVLTSSSLAYGIFDLIPIPFAVPVAPLSGNVWPCTVDSDGFQCYDCNSLVYCENGEAQMYVNCKNQNLRLPYCSIEKNTCVEDYSECSETVNKFKCPYAGRFPEPADCHKYIECLGKGFQGRELQCPGTSVYDHAQQKCSARSRCYKPPLNCMRTSKFVLYPSDPSLFVICQVSKAPSLGSCLDKGYAFDLTSLTCIFNCPAEGFFGDPLDDVVYYNCVKQSRRLVPHELRCNPGEYFDNVHKVCRLIEDLPNTSVEP